MTAVRAKKSEENTRAVKFSIVYLLLSVWGSLEW